MLLKTFRPITPSLRHRTIVDRSLLWSGKPFKKLVKGLKKSGGRNNQGRITVHHRDSSYLCCWQPRILLCCITLPSFSTDQ